MLVIILLIPPQAIPLSLLSLKGLDKLVPESELGDCHLS